MPFDFNPNPAVGDIETLPNGAQYRWDGVKWVAAGGGGGILPADLLPLMPRDNSRHMLGALTVDGDITGAAVFDLDGADAGAVVFKTANLERWAVTANTSLAGGSALHDFDVAQFDGTGNAAGIPLRIRYLSGDVELQRPTTISGDPISDNELGRKAYIDALVGAGGGITEADADLKYVFRSGDTMGGQLIAVAGSTAIPGLAIGDATTGFYHSGTALYLTSSIDDVMVWTPTGITSFQTLNMGGNPINGLMDPTNIGGAVTVRYADANYLRDSPVDSRVYARQDAAWVEVLPGGGGGIPEPVGPAVYGRDAGAAWLPVLPITGGNLTQGANDVQLMPTGGTAGAPLVGLRTGGIYRGGIMWNGTAMILDAQTGGAKWQLDQRGIRPLAAADIVDVEFVTEAIAAIPPGIDEAPIDGALYGRDGLSATWEPTIDEAPIDSRFYGRRDGAWEEADEAPTDGRIYGRQMESWQPITAVPLDRADTYYGLTAIGTITEIPAVFFDLPYVHPSEYRLLQVIINGRVSHPANTEFTLQVDVTGLPTPRYVKMAAISYDGEDWFSVTVTVPVQGPFTLLHLDLSHSVPGAGGPDLDVLEGHVTVIDLGPIYQPPPIIITIIVPVVARVNDPPITDFTVIGDGVHEFSGISTIRVDGMALATTLIDTNTLQATLDPTAIGGPGIKKITVTEGSDTSNALDFELQTPPLSITSIVPTSIAANTVFNLDLYDTNNTFVQNIMRCMFRGTQHPCQWRTSGYVQVQTLNSGPAGTVAVYVFEGTNESNRVNLDVVAIPNINSALPATAAAGSFGDLTCAGTNLTQTTKIVYDGVIRNDTVWNSASLLYVPAATMQFVGPPRTVAVWFNDRGIRSTNQSTITIT